MITVLYARGIGERFGIAGMCQNVIGHLDPGRFRAIEIPWLATYGPVGANLRGASYRDAIYEGERLVYDAISEAPGQVVLLGYSGGASLMGNIASDISAMSDIGAWKKLVGVALIADPHQPRGVSPHGHGVAGPRPIDPLPAWWAYSDRDPIPVTPELSPLRTLADQSAAMSLADPAAWGRDLANRMMRSRFQPSAIDWRDPIGSSRRYYEAAGAVLRYLTHHYSDYRGDLTEQLARQITEGTR